MKQVFVGTLFIFALALGTFGFIQRDFCMGLWAVGLAALGVAILGRE